MVNATQAQEHYRFVKTKRKMQYSLENLGDERFQQLCQALLAKEFPETQCFPVGQADGGRDALISDSKGEGVTVFQVKYINRPASQPDHIKWLKGVLKRELKQLNMLVDRGAKEYVLLTNAPGSGSLDRGSIDCVSKILRELVPISAKCWWRDDIERRLDDAWDIKWAFPEVLNNYDIIRMVLERRETASAGRRAQAVKAAIRDQYEKERDVRFKQVDLRNNLLDLFVDVPIRVPDYEEHEARRKTKVAVLYEVVRRQPTTPDPSRETIGAASLLLDELCQKKSSPRSA